MKVFVSNQLSELAKLLHQRLFSETLHPLEHRWLIVPSEEVKLDLHLRWLETSEVVAGIKTLTYKELIRKIFPAIPLQIELTLRIEHALTHMEIEETLLPFLQEGEHIRRLDLAEELSSLFVKYLRKPKQELLQWLSRDGWQQTLWRTVFGHTLPIDEIIPLKGTYYFYQIEKIAPYEWEAFSHMETYWFLFSPSEMYLGDFYTQREQLFILQKVQPAIRQQLQHYFHEDSPLLSNWAVLSRQLFQFFEEVDTEEAFVRPGGHSALHKLQLEWLTFEKTGGSKTDSSLQLHSAPNLLREVEVVWEIIHRLPDNPRDILILAPTIQPYAAAIEWVFKERGSSFDYMVTGLEAKTHSLFLQGIEILLSLPRHRYSRRLFERLLMLPPFLNRFNITLEEAHLLQTWMKETHLRYDISGSDGSWEMALKRALESLTVLQENPPIHLDCTQASLLNTWIEIFLKMKQQMLPATDQKKRSGPEWACWIEDLIDTFLVREEEAEVIDILLATLRSERIQGTFPYPIIERLLLSTLSTPTGVLHRTTPQAICFSSLEPGPIRSAQTIILMGMVEGAFPRLDPSSSLPAFPLPSRAEEDRYLFLEALSHAKERFIITYARCHADDGKPVHPSSLVEELQQERGALLNFHHPLSALDPSYYQPGPFQSLSSLHYHLLKEKVVPEASPSKPLKQLPSKKNIDLRLLRNLARHPVQFFFEESIGVHFSKDKEDSEFLLSSLDMHQLRLSSLHIGTEELIQNLESRGKLPVGTFRDAALYSIEKEISNYQEALDKIEISSSAIFRLELSPHCRERVQIGPDRWISPPLVVPLSTGESQILIGTVEGLASREKTSYGLLHHGEDSLEDLLKIWPLFCIAQAVWGEKFNTLWFTQKASSREMKIENPLEALGRYLGYLNKALQSPSPLLPSWGRRLLVKGEIPEKSNDPIIEWAHQRNLLPPSETWAHEWRSYLQEVVHELL